jgi:hypothetical protein
MAKSLRSQLYRAARDLGNLEATRHYLKRWIRATGQTETVRCQWIGNGRCRYECAAMCSGLPASPDGG